MSMAASQRPRNGGSYPCYGSCFKSQCEHTELRTKVVGKYVEVYPDVFDVSTPFKIEIAFDLGDHSMALRLSCVTAIGELLSLRVSSDKRSRLVFAGPSRSHLRVSCHM
jgi:hypothetical protein